jgi:hypothetical protein
MDTDTLILFVLTFAAFCWFLKLRIDENRRYVKKIARIEKERLARLERVKQLTNRTVPE